MGQIGILLYLFLGILANAAIVDAAIAQPVISQLKATYEHVVSRRFTPGSKVWDIRNNVPGEPGIDYPTYATPPETSFTCGKQTGYFADMEARCQVFRVCANTDLTGKGFAFLCPNGTLFNQKYFVCDWWKHVNCSQSNQYFGKNSEMSHHLGSLNDMMDAVQKMVDFTKNNGNPYQMMLRKPSADQNNRGKSLANTSATEASRRGGKLPVTMATVSSIETPTTPKSIPISIIPRIKNYVNPIANRKNPTSTPDLSQLNPKLLPNRQEKVKTTQSIVDSSAAPGMAKEPTSDPVLFVNFLGETMAAPQTIRGNYRFTVKPLVISTPTPKPMALSIENRRPTQMPPVSAKLPQYQSRKSGISGQLDHAQTSVGNGNQNQTITHGIPQTKENRFPKRPSLITANHSKTASNEENPRVAVIENIVGDQQTLAQLARGVSTDSKEHVTQSLVSAEAIKPVNPAPSRGDQGVDEYEKYEEPTSQDNPADSVFDLARFDDSVKSNLRTVIAKETEEIDSIGLQQKQTDVRVKQVTFDLDALAQNNPQRVTNTKTPIVSQQRTNQFTKTQVKDIHRTIDPLIGFTLQKSLLENINSIIDNNNDYENENSSTPSAKEPSLTDDKSKTQLFISSLSDISATINGNQESTTTPTDQGKIILTKSDLQSNLAGKIQEPTQNRSLKYNQDENQKRISSIVNVQSVENTSSSPQNISTDSTQILSGNKVEQIKSVPNIVRQGTARNIIPDTGDYLLPPIRDQVAQNLMKSDTKNSVEDEKKHGVSQSEIGQTAKNGKGDVKISITQNEIAIAKPDQSEVVNHGKAVDENLNKQIVRIRLDNMPTSSPISKANPEIQANLTRHSTREQSTNSNEEVNTGEGDLLIHTSRMGIPSNKSDGTGQNVISGENNLLIHTTREGLVNSLSSILSGQNVFSTEVNNQTTVQDDRSQTGHQIPNFKQHENNQTNLIQFGKTTKTDAPVSISTQNATSIETNNISKLQNDLETRAISSLKHNLNAPSTGQYVFTGDGDLLTQTHRERLDRPHLVNETQTDQHAEHGEPIIISQTNRHNFGEIRLGESVNEFIVDETVRPHNGTTDKENKAPLLILFGKESSLNLQPVSSVEKSYTDEKSELQISVKAKSSVLSDASELVKGAQPENIQTVSGQNVYTGEGNLISQTNRKRLQNSDHEELPGTDEGKLLKVTSKNTIKKPQQDDIENFEPEFNGEGILKNSNSPFDNNSRKPSGKQQKDGTANVQQIFSGEGNLQSHTTRTHLNTNNRIEHPVGTGEDNSLIHTSRKPSAKEQNDDTESGRNVFSGEGNLLSLTTGSRLNTKQHIAPPARAGEDNLLSHTPRNPIGKKQEDESVHGQHIFSGEGNLQSHTTRTHLNNSNPIEHPVSTGEDNSLIHTSRKSSGKQQNDDSENGRNVFSGEGNLLSHITRTRLNTDHNISYPASMGEDNLLSQKPRTPIGKQQEDDSAHGQHVFSGEGNLQSHTTRMRLANSQPIDHPLSTGEDNLLNGSPRQHIAIKQDHGNSANGQNVFSGEDNLQKHTTRTRLNITEPIEKSVDPGKGNLLSLIGKQDQVDSENDERVFSIKGKSEYTQTLLETTHRVTGEKVIVGDGKLLNNSSPQSVDKKQLQDDSENGVHVFSGEGNLQSHTSRTRLESTHPVTVENAITVDGNVLSHINHSGKSPPEINGQNVFSGEGNLLRHITRTRIGDVGSEIKQNDNATLVGYMKEASHKPKPGNPDPTGSYVHSGEGNLISQTLRKTIEHDELKTLDKGPEVFLQPIIVPSSSEDSYKNKDNQIVVDNKSKSEENQQDNLNRLEVNNKLVKNSEVKTTINADEQNTNTKTIPSTNAASMANLPSNEYLPIRGLPLIVNRLQKNRVNPSSDDDILTPPHLKPTKRIETTQSPVIRSSSSSNALRPDAVVSDLASWSILQALNNDRIYRNAGYEDRNHRIYRTISNQDIADINSLFN